VSTPTPFLSTAITNQIPQDSQDPRRQSRARQAMDQSDSTGQDGQTGRLDGRCHVLAQRCSRICDWRRFESRRRLHRNIVLCIASNLMLPRDRGSHNAPTCTKHLITLPMFPSPIAVFQCAIPDDGEGISSFVPFAGVMKLLSQVSRCRLRSSISHMLSTCIKQ
jgi:hypothetical protein